MVRTRKTYDAPARPRSTRNGRKTSKQKELEASSRNKRSRGAIPPPRTPSPHPVPSSPPRAQTPSSRASTPLEPEIDVSKVQYELNIVCFLDQKSIITRVKHVTLGEYKLQPFLADTIKTIGQRVCKPTETIAWDTGRAELRHRGLKRITDFPKNDVFDHSDWEEVEKALKTWMTRKALDIRVDLALHFKTIEAEDQPDEDTRSTSAEDEAEAAERAGNGQV